MKYKKIYLLIPLCLIFAAIGCQGSSNETGITWEELETHLTYLAHDDREGRFPGTLDYMEAAEYVRAKLQEPGVDAGF
jgi:hypothetical protein